VAFVGLFLDGCHCWFHSQHGVELESEIINLLYFLQGCRYDLIIGTFGLEAGFV